MVAVAQSLREQVAWACRILAAEGYADLTLGHVSARAPDCDVWIKRKGVALDEVEPEDVVALDGTTAVLHLETVLHTGVYRVRPDVGAVVHGHPPYATALGATRANLSLLTHDAVLFASGVGRFDEPDLIVDEDQAGRVAATRRPRRRRARWRSPLGSTGARSSATSRRRSCCSTSSATRSASPARSARATSRSAAHAPSSWRACR